MSDLLTHWAVFDDVRRLAAHDADVEPLFKRVLDEKHQLARLGALARGGSKWMPHIMQSALARRDALESDEKLLARLAFGLGGILHFPADAVFKPMMSELAQADWDSTHHLMQGRTADLSTTQNAVSIREVSAYFDCHVFRKVYLAGREEPFSRFLLQDNSTEAGRELEAFVRALFQRALLSSHTLAPDTSSFEAFDAWLDALLAKVQPLYIDIALYVRVFEHPDPQKTAFYRVESDFYRDDDALIQLARRAQGGDAIGAEIEAALNGDNRSGYAQCLRRSVQLLREASQFWRGERDTPPDVRQDTNWKPKSRNAWSNSPQSRQITR